MKNPTKILALVLAAVLLAAALTACGASVGNNGGNVWSGGELELYPAYVAVPDGYSLYLDWNTSKAGQEIEWRSSDPAVAAVDADGLITAVSFGETVITASLKGKPEVSVKCGVFVKNYLDAETALNDIVIWEDGPPSLYYRAEAIGVENMSAEVKPALGYEPGVNIPVCFSPDAGVITTVSASSAGQNAPVVPLAAAKNRGKSPVKLSRLKIIDLLKKNASWDIVVEGKYEEVDIMGYYTRYETFSMSATKKGGDTPVGTYNGKAEYYAYNDYALHYAQYPDHSVCLKCTRRVLQKYGEERIEYKGAPTSANDEPLEWQTNEFLSWKGYYTSAEKPGALFQIKQSEMKADNKYTPSKTKLPDFKTTEEFVEWFKDEFVAPVLWFEVRADVYNNYTHIVSQPTSGGSNWGYTRTSENEHIMTLRINIYTDNTVKVRKEGFTGTLVKRIG